MSTYTHSHGYRPQGNFPNRGSGGPRRNDNNRPYRSHPTPQHSQLGNPPIMPHMPRAQTVGPGRVLLTNVPNASQPLLMQPALTGPNARAPTVFPQNLSLVPQAIPQQLIGQNPGAGLPPIFFPQQPQYAATNQPINLGNPAAAAAAAAQLGATNAPQQIPGGIHTMPHMMNTAAGTMNQVAPASTTTYRPQPPRPTSTQGKRQSKAIKIIDPNTKQEVSMADNKPETPQPPPPALMQSDAPTTAATLSSISAPVTTGVTAPFTAPPTGHVTVGSGGGGNGGSVAQDFKRMVHERNVTGAMNTQGSTVTATIPPASVQKPPPPNAIITDPNNKAGAGVGGVVGGGVSNKIGVSEPASSSKTRFDAHIEVQTQQPRSLLGSQPSTSATVTAPTVSEADQKKRDEFRQKVLQSVNQTTSTTVVAAVGDEGRAAAQEEVPVEVKNGSQESSVANRNVGENNQKEGLLPLPLPTPQPQATSASAPLKASPDEPSVKPIGESERTAPSEDKIASVPSVPDTQATTTTEGSEQVHVDAPPSDVVTDVQPAPVELAQPEKAENEETSSIEVKGDVSPPPVSDPTPPPAPPSTEEVAAPPPPEKIEEKDTEEESTESIQVTDSQVIVDSEEAAPVTNVVADEQKEVESKVIEEESGGEKKLQEDNEQKVELSQPPATQEAPEAEPQKPEEEEVKKEEEEEKPSLSKSEPEQGEREEPVTKPEAAVPSSAVLVSESPAPARKVKEEAPSAATVKELPSEAERTEVRAPDSSVEAEAKVEESKPAVTNQKEKSISRENEAKEKEANGEPKESLPPKKVQEDERSAVVPAATKSAKPEKAHTVSEGKSTPPTKPKEVVKTVEQSVKSEKQDRPASAKPVPAVPASAQLAPASSEPPSVPQPSQNPFGRTMYPREFLLKFKEHCKDVPPELKTSTDVFKLNAHHDHNITPGPVMSRGDYQSQYSRDRDRDRDRDRGDYRKGGGRRADSRRGGGGYQQPPVSKEPVDLHKAEHRWVRPRSQGGETEELFRKFQGILNKLTPQKFQNLAEQALQLKIDDEERLKGCIDKIFTKALEEPKFSIAYANLCKVMSTIKVEVPTEPEGKPKVITFRRVLLTKCQQEFEKDKRDDEERENMLNAIKETEDAEKKKQLEDDLEVCEVRNRKRSLGNIRFIGELFKLKMLSETIMHECVVRLLRSSSDEESLECFAGLITTTGKDLDKPEAKTRIDQYFTRIAEIIKKGKVPARIKFMLQDVQELRGNNWVPRLRQEQSLKTIDQIHHEAKVEEEKEKQFVAQAFAGGMKHGGGSRRGSMKPDDWSGGGGGGGKGDRDRDRRDKDRDRDRERDRDRDRDKPKEKLDARKLQVLLKHREKKDLGAPMLGPGSGLRPQGWGRGGAGGSSATQDSTKTDKDKRTSRTSSSGNKRSDKDKLPISGRGSGSSTKRPHSTPTPDNQSERALAIQAAMAMTRPSSQPKQEQHQQQPKGRGEHRAPQPAQDKMDEATVRRKTVTIVDELVQNKDFKEAIECVKEMKSPGKMNHLVSEAINHSLEKSSQHREFSGKLFSKLVQGRQVSEAKFLEGLNEVLEFAEDIAIDIPKIWDYLSEILSPIVSKSTLSLSFLGSTFPSLLSSGKAGLLAAKILVHCRNQLSSDDDVVSLWSGASLEWSALGVAADDLGEFLARHDLTYLQGSSQPSSGSQPLKYVTELTHQFRASDTTNDEITTWIEKNCQSSTLRTPEFITTVTTAIVNATVSDSGSNARFEEDSFSKRAQLIKKYVDNDKDLQLRVLYALQIAVTHLQHPPGILNGMFNQIYDLEIVGEEEFRRWRDKGTEGFGKGAAVTTVKHFFDWLDSGETESDNDT